MKLNLGCGKEIKKDFINLDFIGGKGVDVVFNLEDTNYNNLPFTSSSFSYVLADNVMEHIHNFLPLMKEINRICKKNSTLEIIVPHFKSIQAHVDPTHVRFFAYNTMDYFERNNFNHPYIGSNYKVISKKLSFRFDDAKTLRAKIYNLFGGLLSKLSLISPSVYERFSFGIFAPQSITYKLKVIK